MISSGMAEIGCLASVQSAATAAVVGDEKEAELATK